MHVMQCKQTGFTFIELMFVIAIIGILASVAIPQYQVYLNRARVAEAFILLPPIKKAVATYYAHTGEFPTDNHAAALPAASLIRGDYVSQIQIEHGAIHITLKLSSLAEGAQPEQGFILSIRPVQSPEALPYLYWLCGEDTQLVAPTKAVGENKTTLPTQYLPSHCV